MSALFVWTAGDVFNAVLGVLLVGVLIIVAVHDKRGKP